MSRSKNVSFKIISIFVLNLFVSDSVSSNCPLWQVPGKHGECECSGSLKSLINCTKNSEYLYVRYGHCLTWNNSTSQVEVHTCLFTRHWNHNDSNFTCAMLGNYRIPVGIPHNKLNRFTCYSYNRQGTGCKHCLEGYGHPVFSDGNTCADCTSHRHFWILNLLFHLIMVTIMYLIFIPLQIDVTSSPLNVIITYFQIALIGFKLNTAVHAITVCYFGRAVTNTMLTIVGFVNLDFFMKYSHHHALIQN